jgi:hypothetical protein
MDSTTLGVCVAAGILVAGSVFGLALVYFQNLRQPKY